MRARGRLDDRRVLLRGRDQRNAGRLLAHHGLRRRARRQADDAGRAEAVPDALGAGQRVRYRDQHGLSPRPRHRPVPLHQDRREAGTGGDGLERCRRGRHGPVGVDAEAGREDGRAHARGDPAQPAFHALRPEGLRRGGSDHQVLPCPRSSRRRAAGNRVHAGRHRKGRAGGRRVRGRDRGHAEQEDGDPGQALGRRRDRQGGRGGAAQQPPRLPREIQRRQEDRAGQPGREHHVQGQRLDPRRARHHLHEGARRVRALGPVDHAGKPQRAGPELHRHGRGEPGRGRVRDRAPALRRRPRSTVPSRLQRRRVAPALPRARGDDRIGRPGAGQAGADDHQGLRELLGGGHPHRRLGRRQPRLRHPGRGHGPQHLRHADG